MLSALDLRAPEPFYAEVARLYADDMVFRDPMQTCRGKERFLAMNRKLVKMSRALRFDVSEVTGDASLFYIHWVMTMRPVLGPEVRVEGVSRLRGRDGLVIEHVDYWDLGELLASPVGGQALLHTLFRPFV
jgi:hypothetical protein